MTTTLVDRYSRAGHEGQIADTRTVDTVTRINDHPRAQQTVTVLVATANNNSLYKLTILGIVIGVTSAGSATDAGIAEQIEEAIIAEPLLYGRLEVTRDSATVTLRARIGGLGFTVTDADARLTVTTTAANATAAPVPVGRCVIQDAADARLARLAEATSLTQQTATIAPAADDSTLFAVSITVNGTSYRGAHTTAGSGGTNQTIATALKAELDAILPASTITTAVEGSGSAGRLVLTATAAGQAFSIGLEGPISIESQSSPPTSDINRALLGVAAHRYSQAQGADGALSYAPQSSMSVLTRGACLVRPEDTPTINGPVFVRLASTGDKGRFRGSAAAGCVRIHGWKWGGPVGDGLHLLILP